MLERIGRWRTRRKIVVGVLEFVVLSIVIGAIARASEIGRRASCTD